MIDTHPDAHLLTAVVWIILLFVNYFLNKIANEYEKRQKVVVYEDDLSVQSLSPKYFLGSILFGILLFLWGSLINDFWFKFFFGGFVFAQAIAMTISIKNIGALKLLLDPSLVKGQMRVSSIYSYKRLARDLFSMSFLCIFLYIFWASP